MSITVALRMSKLIIPNIYIKVKINIYCDWLQWVNLERSLMNVMLLQIFRFVDIRGAICTSFATIRA